jgi:hypothetical protein
MSPFGVTRRVSASCAPSGSGRETPPHLWSIRTHLPVPECDGLCGQLARSLAAAAPHSQHVWRDSPAMNPDGTVNGYIEIPRGERRKYEYETGSFV